MYKKGLGIPRQRLNPNSSGGNHIKDCRAGEFPTFACGGLIKAVFIISSNPRQISEVLLCTST